MGKEDSLPILIRSFGIVLLRNTRKVSGTWLVPSIQSGRPVLLVRDSQNLCQLRGCSGLDQHISTRQSLLLWDQGGDSGRLPCPDPLPDRCDSLGRLASTCIYPRDGDLTTFKASYQTFAGLCPDLIPRVTPEHLSTGPPEM